MKLPDRSSMLAGLALAAIILGAIAIDAIRAQVVYHDWRCMMAECRLVKK